MAETTAPQPTAEDFIEQMKVFGLGSDGSLAQVRPFRISTMQEATIMRAVFMKVSGLNAEQFAENPWGFPFVPYPAVVSGRRSMLPENVTYEYASHPLYWIDTSLTRPTRAERTDPSRWTVRMFYLMLALGLMDPDTLQWIPAPKGKGVVVSQADLQNHRSDFDSPLAHVLYTAQDLAVPFEEVTAQANDALAQLEALQERQWAVYREEQRSATAEAEAVLSSEDAEWEDINGNIHAISEALAAVVTKGRGSKTELVTPAYEQAARLIALVNRYERLCVVLASPVLRAQSRSTGAYTSVATAMQMYNHTVTNGGHEQTINAALEETFSAESSLDVDKLVVFANAASNLYLDVHNRLDLSVENFKMVEQGQQPYADYEELRMGRSLVREGGDRNITAATGADDMMSTGLDAELEKLLKGEQPR